MNVLLIVAHGSRLKESNEEIIRFCEKIQNKSDNDTIVKYAFLELAKPSIIESLDMISNSFNNCKISILPYFLAEGKHVKIDIPNEVNEFKLKKIDCDITILPHLGKTEGLVSLLLDTYCK